MDDWYFVTEDQVTEFGGAVYLTKFSSLLRALQSIYPNHRWEMWKFGTVSMGHWKKKENHINFFDWLKRKMGFKSMDDWYNVTQEDIHRNGGGGLLLSYFRNSPSLALQSVYPQHPWMIWRFKQTSNRYWENLDNQRSFLSWLHHKIAPE